MLFEGFTGSFLGVPGMRERIDTRLLTDNVFYREKTFLRQLFFHEGRASLGANGAATKARIAHDAFRGDSIFGVMR
ncbi:hypothetical protein LHFGNBLO_001906 [Mesorhizobium sp. AR10]|uniref:hypothetical protein n=1 Tax=Mesorhizobium sp. AR10 TaxID=2865839 RepID=UPI00215E4966|nr:hypothetical protein [Mesorhizobium sp. AR10]UVK40438.1 hypothetical protein LHFGNBLO_001906 [Mesorhizobium sp. AR10]